MSVRSLLRLFGLLFILSPRAGKNIRDAIVGLVAGEFEDRPVGLRQRRFGRPRTVPGLRILDRELVIDHVIRDASKTLGDLHVLARAAKRILPVEIRRLDYERIAFPSASRHADPLPQTLCGLRAV